MTSEPSTIYIYIRLDVAMGDIHQTLAILREVLSTTSVACTHGNFASGKTLILIAILGHDAPFLYSIGSTTGKGGEGL